MKKLMRKLLSVVAALTMVLGMAIPTMAAEPVRVTPNGKGSITISNAVKGETYTVYKLFDAMANSDTGAIVYGKLSTDQNLGGYFDLDSEGYVVAKDDTKAAIENDNSLENHPFQTWARENGKKGESKTANANGELKFENLDYGYYFVTSSQGVAISVDSLNPNATITDKNTSTPIVQEDAKAIIDANGNAVSQTSAAIGEDVNFRIMFDARNYDGNKLIKNYTIVDTPTNLSIITDSVQVRVVENDGKNPTTDIHDITKNITSGIESTGLNITIPWVNDVDAENPASLYANKSKIVINYTATVTAAADTGDAHNKATITWTGKENPEEPQEPHVKNYSFTVKKVDGESKAVQLEGAEFKLYTADGKEVPVVAVNGIDGKVSYYRVAAKDEKGVNIVAGNATVKGLKEGSYQLEEEVAPNGYNKLTEKTKAFTVDKNSSEEGVDVTVENNRGAKLPTTGGMGTTIFYVLGAALVIGAGVVLVTRRRLSK